METINQNNDIEKKVIENFFKILLLKEFIHDGAYEDYYISFLDENNIFNKNLLKEKIDKIYKRISGNDITFYRPNNVGRINQNSFKNIIEEFGDDYIPYSPFSDDILTHFQAGSFDFISMYNEPKLPENWKTMIESVKKGMTKYLKSLYSNGVYSIETGETMDEIINKTFEIIKNIR